MLTKTLGAISSFALAITLLAAAPLRADTLFTNFGPGQTYVGNSWWNVGGVPGDGTEAVAFPFMPTETATLTGADLALAQQVATLSPLNVYIESNSAGSPGSILDTLTQHGSFAEYPVTTVVNFTCSTCTVLDAGTLYWIVGQQSDSATLAAWLWSFGDTGSWNFDDNGSATGPWTLATTGDEFSAFDVTGDPLATPEPASFLLLASAMAGLLMLGYRRSRAARFVRLTHKTR